MRVAGLARRRPTIRACELDSVADGIDPALPKLSIIVPAHNEERVIDACCRSLRGQLYPDLEIVFVLDRCTDRTLDIARQHAAEDGRIVVIENDSCPEDWAGKCNAARLGAERATGEFLLFTDADTQFEPDLCRAAVTMAITRGAKLLSLLTSLTYKRNFERIAQPVATMQLMRIYPPQRQRSSKQVRPFANGQFMLFSRDWYETIGGHSAVKDDLLEDLAFARLTQQAGGETAVLLADGMLRCSMYDSVKDFQTGWKRIFIEACRRKPKRLRKHARRILLTGIGLPIAQIASLLVAAILFAQGMIATPVAMLAVTIIGWAIQFAALVCAYRLAGAPISAIIFYPIGSWITAKAMLDGAADLTQRRPVRWGGREYVLEPRGSQKFEESLEARSASSSVRRGVPNT